MPAAPKPSQQKEQDKMEKLEKKPQKPDTAKTEKKKSGGHLSAILAMAKAAGGLTAVQVKAECIERKLQKRTGGNYVWAVRKAGLLKEGEACAS